jgi:hypothetical protein
LPKSYAIMSNWLKGKNIYNIKYSIIKISHSYLSKSYSCASKTHSCVSKSRFSCRNRNYAYVNHTREYRNHTHKCQNHILFLKIILCVYKSYSFVLKSHPACRNHILRVKITLVYIEITLGSVFTCMRVNFVPKRVNVCMSIRHAIYYCVD